MRLVRRFPEQQNDGTTKRTRETLSLSPWHGGSQHSISLAIVSTRYEGELPAAVRREIGVPPLRARWPSTLLDLWKWPLACGLWIAILVGTISNYTAQRHTAHQPAPPPVLAPSPMIQIESAPRSSANLNPATTSGQDDDDALHDCPSRNLSSPAPRAKLVRLPVPVRRATLARLPPR